MTVKTYTSLADALLAAQAAMEQPKKSATNPHFRSKYAPLDECVNAAVPVLNAHGIVIVQPCETTEDGRIGVRTLLMGYGETLDLGMLTGHAPDNPQHVGSMLTYYRRYALNSALMQAAEDDDDGNAASAPRQQAQRPASGGQLASEAQVKMIWAVSKAAGISPDQLHAGIHRDTGKEHVDQLTKSEATALIDKLKEAEARNKAEAQPEPKRVETMAELMENEEVPF